MTRVLTRIDKLTISGVAKMLVLLGHRFELTLVRDNGVVPPTLNKVATPE